MSESSVRIDKWLWAARFFKTRSLAGDAVEHGKVKVNGARVKPARPVRLLDELEIDNGAETWEVHVRGLSDQRASAPVARTLYLETEQSIARREQAKNPLLRDPGAGQKGRPGKHERRQLSKVSGEF